VSPRGKRRHLFDHCDERKLSHSLDSTSFTVISIGFATAVVPIVLGASGML